MDEEPLFTLSVQEAWELSSFLQERMTDEESVTSEIGTIASRVYHWCREHPDL